jgi:CheY-like chemotaxis protein
VQGLEADRTKVHTLLLADDSVTIQRVIELTFADEDVRVVAVSDGGEAIAMLDRTPPDIVLADVGMPGQNGYEVARHIRDTPRLAHIPIVLLTGAFEPIDQAKVAEVGCDGVLAKPFEPQLVIARVKELLARPKEIAPPVSIAPDVTQAPPPSEPASRQELDSYFDRLDAAFSNLPGGAAPQEAGLLEFPSANALDWADAPTPPIPAVSTGAPVDDEGPLADLPSSAAADARPREQPRGEAPPALPRASTFPPLADAFAALLAAEQSAPAPTAAPAWPVNAAPGWLSAFQAPAPALPDDFVDQVTRRVLDQLSDRAVRETTAEIVSAVAERLVKEEIERIKRQIDEGVKG